ncbi:MAG: translation elongation factor Ts [Marinilabiliales bacterium]
MTKISASDVAKLRKATGAGMMDCKNALVESEGDFDKAIEIIRKKGKAIANKRADRDATEGVVLAKVTEDKKHGALIVLNCETDFVAKNEKFIEFAYKILETALLNKPSSLEELKQQTIDNISIDDRIKEETGIIGEKIDLSFYSALDAEMLTAYIHPGNKIASLIGLNMVVDDQIGKDIAMQVTAMNPVSISEKDVPEEIKQKELEIGKEQARQEGKPEELLDKIALGKLNKFYKESTLLNQQFIKDQKISVNQYLKQFNKELTVTGFIRYALEN